MPDPMQQPDRSSRPPDLFDLLPAPAPFTTQQEAMFAAGTTRQQRYQQILTLLGARGPLHPADLPANVKVLDCSMAIGTREPHPVPAADTEPNWIGHQYFRNDCCVRADMVAALLEDAAPEVVPGRRWGTASATGISEHADRLYPAV